MSTKPLGSIVAVLAAATIVAGCTSSRLGGVNTQPPPLVAAPSGTVTSNQLPPPSAPTTATTTTDPTGTGAPTDLPVQQEPDPTQLAAAAGPVSRDAMVGAWRVSTAGASCQMFMALTPWSTGFRAASRGCPGDAANVSSWNVSGNQVVLSDSGGNQVATLFQSAEGRFDGQTNGGQAISLAR